MICKLCLKDKPLIKKTHIIPDFMYQGLFDDMHFIASVHLIEMKIGKMKPSDFYDSDILCAECENNVLSTLESYARKVLFGGIGNPEKHHKCVKVETMNDNNLLHYENVDYIKFKLFLLSILWRSSISRQKIFNDVNLGEHEEIIRKMIFEYDAKTENDYPVGIMVLKKNNQVPTSFIVNPVNIQNDENLSYIIMVNGFVIYCNLFGNALSNILETLKIKENNTMPIIMLSKYESIEYVNILLKKKLRYI